MMEGVAMPVTGMSGNKKEIKMIIKKERNDWGQDRLASYYNGEKVSETVIRRGDAPSKSKYNLMAVLRRHEVVLVQRATKPYCQGVQRGDVDKKYSWLTRNEITVPARPPT